MTCKANTYAGGSLDCHNPSYSAIPGVALYLFSRLRSYSGYTWYQKITLHHDQARRAIPFHLKTAAYFIPSMWNRDPPGKLLRTTLRDGDCCHSLRLTLLYCCCIFRSVLCILPRTVLSGKGGEDAYFVLEHDLGVFDGVGGWGAIGHDPGVFTRGFAQAVAGII